MKRLGFFMGLLVVGCSGKALPPPSTAPVAIVREAPSVPDPERIHERPKDAPRIGMGVHLSQRREVCRGWPLLVDVMVSHPGAGMAAEEGRALTSIQLIPASGGWDSLVTVHFVGAQREEVSWPWVPVFHTDGALVLDEKATSHSLGWYLGPEETRGLVPGEYAAFALLESRHGAQQGGWVGRVGSVPLRLEVVDEPVPLSLELAERKAVLFARYELYRGNASAAVSTLDAHLAQQPDSVGALALKAELMERAGELERAYTLYGQTLDVFFRKHPNAREPPFELIARARALRERLNSLPTP